MAKRNIPRPYANGTLTESAFFGKIRSAIRRIEWKPKRDYKRSKTIITPVLDEKGEQKKFLTGRRKGKPRTIQMFECEECRNMFKGSEVQVDHIIPCGSLRRWEDIVPFIQRCLCEEGFQILCKKCHLYKTNKERKNNKK